MDENKVLADWLTLNLGMSWNDSINTPGLLTNFYKNGKQKSILC